jgi:hypothetical protein
MADFTSALDGLLPSESIMAPIWRGPNRELANGSPPFVLSPVEGLRQSFFQHPASHSMPPRLLEIAEEMEKLD